MKAGSAQFSVFRVDGFDLLPAKLQTATYKITVPLEMTAGLGDRWEEHTPTGLRRVTITQTGAYFDTRQNMIHDVFKDTPLTARELVLAPAGDVPGSPLITATGAFNASYDVLAKNAALTKANVTYVISGSVTESVLVQAPTVHASTWANETIPALVVDRGAATAGGGVAYQQAVDVTGLTGFVGTIRHSPDGVVWADLIAFPNLTAAGPPSALAITGTIDRYVSFSGTLAGTGTIRVVASLKRN